MKVLAKIHKRGDTYKDLQEVDLFDTDRNPLIFPAASPPPAPVGGIDSAIYLQDYSSPTIVPASSTNRFGKMRSTWLGPDSRYPPDWLSKSDAGVLTFESPGEYSVRFRAQGTLKAVGDAGTEYEVGVALVSHSVTDDAVFQTAIETQWIPAGYNAYQRRFGLSVHTDLIVQSPPISFGAWVYFSVQGPDPASAPELNLVIPSVREIDSSDNVVSGDTPLNVSGYPTQLHIVRLGDAPSSGNF